MTDVILVAGASVRAAAESARRGGLRVVAADLFCDADLVAESRHEVRNYPEGLVPIAHALPALDWMYTGAMENHPQTIARVSERHRLLGNAADVVRRVRDPLALEAALTADHLHYPRLQIAEAPLARWLVKPRRSAGGHAIHFWNPRMGPPGRRSYLQEYQRGIPLSAVFLAAGGRSVLLGITRQLIGARFAGADRFRYCGSLGPCRLDPAEIDEVRRIGQCLARSFHLRGLFGADLVRNSALWTVEVNPRYTASIEVLERSGAIGSAVALHVAACRDGELPAEPPLAGEWIAGKLILYARRAIEIGARQSDALARAAGAKHDAPAVSDRPKPGTHIDPGHPLVSLHARAVSATGVLQSLKQLADSVAARLGAVAAPRASQGVSESAAASATKCPERPSLTRVPGSNADRPEK